jgi:peroxiredoxin
MNNKAVILISMLIIGIALVFLMKDNTSSNSSSDIKATTGLPAPLFELKDIHGKTWNLANLKGKVVLLNFWATWCDSCRTENPSVQKLVESEKGDNRFIFLSVLFKDEPSRAIEYMKENNFDFNVLVDSAGLSSKYKIRGVPETFIIDKEGVIRQKVIGPIEWDSADVRESIAKLINDK